MICGLVICIRSIIQRKRKQTYNFEAFVWIFQFEFKQDKKKPVRARVTRDMAPSSRGLGHQPLTLETGVRISGGSPKQS